MADFPVPSFYFSVELGGTEIPFQEVGGLGVEIEVEEIPDGVYTNTARKGLKKRKYANLTLKKGRIKGDSTKFAELIKIIADATKDIKQVVSDQKGKIPNIIVHLKDEKGSNVMNWTFSNAYMVKCNISKLNAQESQIAIEEAEFIFDTMSIS